MNLQEQVSKIKSMMGIVNEATKTEDDFDWGVDTTQDDADKWKTTDDYEDEEKTDIEGTTEDYILKKVRKTINETGLDNVDINYIGQQSAKVISKRTGNAVKLKAKLVNVTIVLDNGELGEDEYVSFVVVIAHYPDKNEYLAQKIYKAENMIYHHNGKQTEINDRTKNIQSNGQNKTIEYNPIFDLLSNMDDFRTKLGGAIRGTNKHFQNTYS